MCFPYFSPTKLVPKTTNLQQHFEDITFRTSPANRSFILEVWEVEISSCFRKVRMWPESLGLINGNSIRNHPLGVISNIWHDVLDCYMKTASLYCWFQPQRGTWTNKDPPNDVVKSHIGIMWLTMRYLQIKSNNVRTTLRTQNIRPHWSHAGSRVNIVAVWGVIRKELG